jgi:hypothetical protein
VVPWEEMQQITQDVVNHSVNFVPAGRTHVYHVKRHDGKTWRFDDHYKNIEQLGRNVNTNIIRVQLPAVIQEFRAGNPVRFGALTFDRKGVSHGKTLVPWAEFKSIDYDGGYLRVHKQKDGVRGAVTGGTIVVHVSGLPNVYLLDAFIREIMRWSQAKAPLS